MKSEVVLLLANLLLVSSAPWDFSVSLSGYALNKSLLVTQCESDARLQIANALGASRIDYAIEEPSNEDPNRVLCMNDTTMEFVMKLRINRDLDDDSVTGSTDRQRMEIKTPLEHLGGPVAKSGSTFAYAWWFRLNSDINPPAEIGKFFHIFQIKANTGETEPLVTFSLHPSGKLRLRVVESQGASATYYDLANIVDVAGTWNEAVVFIHYDSDPSNGYIDAYLRNSRGVDAHQRVGCQTFWNNADYFRSKWGLYRSKSTAYNEIDFIKLQNVQILHK